MICLCRRKKRTAMGGLVCKPQKYYCLAGSGSGVFRLMFFFEFVHDQPDLFVSLVVEFGEEDDLAVLAFDVDGGILGLALGVGEGDLQPTASHFEGSRPVAGVGVDGAGHRGLVTRGDADGRFVEFDDGVLVFGALDAAVGAEVLGLRGGEDYFFLALAVAGEAGAKDCGGHKDVFHITHFRLLNNPKLYYANYYAIYSTMDGQMPG